MRRIKESLRRHAPWLATQRNWYDSIVFFFEFYAVAPCIMATVRELQIWIIKGAVSVGLNNRQKQRPFFVLTKLFELSINLY